MIFIIFNVINNTHIVAGVFSDLTAAQAAFANSCTTKTHYLAAYPANTLISEEMVGKVAGRMVIEDIAKRENAEHEYVSWFVPNEVQEVPDGVVENTV